MSTRPGQLHCRKGVSFGPPLTTTRSQRRRHSVSSFDTRRTGRFVGGHLKLSLGEPGPVRCRPVGRCWLRGVSGRQGGRWRPPPWSRQGLGHDDSPSRTIRAWESSRSMWAWLVLPTLTSLNVRPDELAGRSLEGGLHASLTRCCWSRVARRGGQLTPDPANPSVVEPEMASAVCGVEVDGRVEAGAAVVLP